MALEISAKWMVRILLGLCFLYVMITFVLSFQNKAGKYPHPIFYIVVILGIVVEVWWSINDHSE